MGQTATVNKKGKGKKGKGKKKNPTGYGAAAKRNKAGGKKPRKKPRKNPGTSIQSAYSSGGYRQRPNPSGLITMNQAMEIIPAGVAGIGVARFAVKQSGPFEATPQGPAPGAKHALGIWLAASVGGDIVGNLLGNKNKSLIAKIAALSWGGDLFARKRFFRDNKWMQENLYMDGFEETSPLAGRMGSGAVGEEFIDAAGNRYVNTPQGWQLAGNMGQDDDDIVVPDDAGPGDVIQTDSGEYYQLGSGAGLGQDEFDLIPMTDAQARAAMGGGVAPDLARVRGGPISGFEETSPLAGNRGYGRMAAVPSESSNFGYALRRV